MSSPIFLSANNDKIIPLQTIKKNEHYNFSFKVQRYQTISVSTLPSTLTFSEEVQANVNGDKYSVCTLDGYLLDNISIDINAEGENQSTLLRYSITTTNLSPILEQEEIEIKSIENESFDFHLHIQDENITNLNTDTFKLNFLGNSPSYEITESFNTENQSCNLTVSMALSNIGKNELFFTVSDENNLHTEQCKLTCYNAKKLLDVNFDSFDSNVVFNLEDYKQKDEIVKMEIGGEESNILSNPFHNNPQPVSTSMKILLDENVSQEASTILSSVMNAFQNTSINFMNVVSLDFLKNNDISTNDIIDKLKPFPLNDLKSYGLTYIDFKHYENVYNTNLNLKNNFTALEAKILSKYQVELHFRGTIILMSFYIITVNTQVI